MGASGRTWMNLRMEEQYYQQLHEDVREVMQIMSIEEEYDYSLHEAWKEANREAGMAYAKKKEIERMIKNNDKLKEDEN